MTEKTFKEAKAANIEKLEQFIPIVQRVHGENHPEIFKVGEQFDYLNEKIKGNKENLKLNEEFDELREITDDYKVPADVCESYEAVYQMLEELDQSYSKE